MYECCSQALLTPGDADDLAGKVEEAWAHPEEMAAMGRAARAEYEAKYTGRAQLRNADGDLSDGDLSKGAGG